MASATLEMFIKIVGANKVARAVDNLDLLLASVII